MNEHYSQCLKDAEQAAAALNGDLESIAGSKGERSLWIEQFKEYHNFTELDRKIVVTLVKEIRVFEDMEIDLIFKHEKKCQSAVSFAQSVYEMNPFEGCALLEGVV